MKKPQGLTNKITLKDDIMTKTSTPFVDYFLDRKSEANLYEELSKQNHVFLLKPISWGFKTDNTFYSKWKYIDNTFTFIDKQWLSREKEIQLKVISLIEQFHNIKIEMPKFNPKQYLEKFRSKIMNPLVNLTEYEHMLNFVIDNYYTDAKIVLSHNDLVPGNFLFINEKDIKLIDFEYVSLNNELFDYGGFITETLPSDKEEEFIKLLNFDETKEKKLRYIIFYQYILWINWANYMFEQTNEKIYKDIVYEKHNRLINDIKLKDLEF